MEQYINKSFIVAEIERMLQKEYPCDNSEQEAGYDFALYELQEYLDTLEVKEEEPVSNDLEEAAKKVGQKYFPDEENIWARPNYEAKKAECAFKEGAKWGKNQAKVKIQAQSMSLAHGCPKEEPASKDLGEYINELSKQFPEVSFAKLSRIAVRVANWQKEQMVDKACEFIETYPHLFMGVLISEVINDFRNYMKGE